MTEKQATYATTKAPTEPTEHRAFGRAVFAILDDGTSRLMCICLPTDALSMEACEMAERIAKMMNGQAI